MRVLSRLWSPFSIPCMANQWICVVKINIEQIISWNTSFKIQDRNFKKETTSVRSRKMQIVQMRNVGAILRNLLAMAHDFVFSPASIRPLTTGDFVEFRNVPFWIVAITVIPEGTCS